MAPNGIRKPASPDPRLQLDSRILGQRRLPREFFRRDTEHVARALLGTWLVRRYRNRWYGARIVETEAYLGVEDAAAHSFQGRRTPRVEPMYRDGGHLYVFFVYGMHYCANIVTRSEGIPEAVLLRAAEGPEQAPPKLLSGPGRLCSALGITAASSGLDLLSDGDLFLLEADNAAVNVGKSRRIGVDYAGEAAAWPLRFFDRASTAISGPAGLRY